MHNPALIVLVLAAYAFLDWAIYEVRYWKVNGRYSPGECCRRFWNYYLRGRNYDGSPRS